MEERTLVKKEPYLETKVTGKDFKKWGIAFFIAGMIMDDDLPHRLLKKKRGKK